MSTGVYTKLNQIQSELVAPKTQTNTFGKYKYRNLDDINEALKPLLNKFKAIVTLNDEIVLIGDRYYIKATATLIDTEDGSQISTTALAREDENKKGMDLSQLTGATSSYARKYAMNGLFAIDDSRDADALNQGEQKDNKAKKVDLISEAQQNLMVKLANEKGVTDKMGIIIKEQTGKSSSGQLTKEEAAKIIKILQNTGQ